jgi:hypothetical protein
VGFFLNSDMKVISLYTLKNGGCKSGGSGYAGGGKGNFGGNREPAFRRFDP